MKISPVRTAHDLHATAALFEAYAKSLPVDLSYQDFGAELASLPGKYAPPRGELLLARDAAGEALGCVGLRPLDAAGCCEMKRLYLTPEARGTGLGRVLVAAIIQCARDIGYSELRLDTLATMTSAIGLYRQMGFAEIEPYYAPTPPGTTFMALRL
ncbi:GNAT family N-acetyltransferase [Phenylobacterium sp.]|uniref:GNAT family N-acetyltransferase n=1 Tax=Phenylobacterium sp. TaxID=1871053 RepID=UPI002FCB8D67